MINKFNVQSENNESVLTEASVSGDTSRCESDILSEITEELESEFLISYMLFASMNTNNLDCKRVNLKETILKKIQLENLCN